MLIQHRSGLTPCADDTHVYPLNDRREHITEGTECPCNPRIEIIGASLLIIHNAWDNREMFEQIVDFLKGKAK